MKVVRLSSFDRSARKAGVTEGLVADLARRLVEETIFLILAYKKASQEDLTAEQKKRIRALVEELKR